ncbi:hypothetical protein L950_0206880 [Sphingobacterium sp. IITKGP-BTPF85]|nr:hypothetical protein L950_0206880 [Sphingobacterium sp. IITKGP-BTPF85]
MSYIRPLLKRDKQIDKKRIMKRYISTLIVATAISTVHAQNTAENSPTNVNKSEGTIFGQIIDSQGKPISKASINLFQVIKDQKTIRKEKY